MNNRPPSTTIYGTPFLPNIIDMIWEKARVVPNYGSREYRQDRCGAWIRKASYGTTGDYGWEIDHEKPVALNGTDDLSNLQPLHWRNNRGKADQYPGWTCTLS